jgi:replication fork protection complex subunit Tof1/Swi1
MEISSRFSQHGRTTLPESRRQSWLLHVVSRNERKYFQQILIATVELLVPLTWPLEVSEHMTVNHHRHTPYLQIAQIKYKRGILNHPSTSILRKLVRIALPSIAEPRDERSARDEGIIKLLLYSIRNIVMISIPHGVPFDGNEDDFSRSATMKAFHQQDIFQLLLTLASGMGEDFKNQDMAIMEVLFHLLKGIDPADPFLSVTQAAAKKTTSLSVLLAKENQDKRTTAKHAATRHNRFGTMIWVKRDEHKMSVVSGQKMLQSEEQALEQIDKSKKWKRPRGGKNSKETLTPYTFDSTEKLNENVLPGLRDFLENFLDAAFNPLFSHIRKAIERDHERVQEHHRLQFFYLVAWFLEAERMRRKANIRDRDPNSPLEEAESFELVASVLNQETFIILVRFMQKAYDDKPKNFQELNASMRCFTQIVSPMFGSN